MCFRESILLSYLSVSDSVELNSCSVLWPISSKTTQHCEQSQGCLLSCDWIQQNTHCLAINLCTRVCMHRKNTPQDHTPVNKHFISQGKKLWWPWESAPALFYWVSLFVVIRASSARHTSHFPSKNDRMTNLSLFPSSKLKLS